MEQVYYLERGSSGCRQISLKTKLFEQRVIYLDEPVDSTTVNQAVQQFTLLAALDGKQPITLVINSPGGSIRAGLVLIDVMRSFSGPVRTVSLGIAASMAAVILAAGTHGQRFITPHSQVMLHQPLLAGGLPGGSCSEVESVARSLMERKQELDDLLVRFTGRPKQEIRRLTAKDTYLKADQAIRHGLVDAVAEGELLYDLMGGALV